MPIVPSHEQHYPEHLLPHRLEEYVLDNAPPTQNRAYAKRVTGAEVLNAVLQAQKDTGLINIDPRYYVGTCFHEAGCVNEWDTEVASPSSPQGFVSVGAFQIGQEEAQRYGFQLPDMLDLYKSVVCMVKLAEYNRTQIRGALGLGPSDPDPEGMRAYLAISHNKGNGYMRQTVKAYGLNWPAYKQRNPLDPLVAHGYGDDCITGGSNYPIPGSGSTVSQRVLVLMNPFMTGDDVKELQRHLKLVPDGVYGPKTKQAVVDFQQTHGLTADGVVGPSTWSQLLAT